MIERRVIPLVLVTAATLLGAGPGPDAAWAQPVGARAGDQDTRASRAMEPYSETIPGTLVTFRMIPVPAGRVVAPGGDGADDVEVGPFWMGEVEVTWDLFDVWVFGLDRGGQVATGKGEDAVSRPSKPYLLPGSSFGHHGRPALAMTHHAAARFAEWLSETTGRRYRLPTEAEWEHACRAGSTAPPDELAAYAWFWDNADDRTHPGAERRPNEFGLYDMLGNVAEWVDTRDGVPVIKGGAFSDDPPDVHCGARRAQTPAWNATDPQLPRSRWWLPDAPFVGFRLLREP